MIGPKRLLVLFKEQVVELVSRNPEDLQHFFARQLLSARGSVSPGATNDDDELAQFGNALLEV